MMLAPTLLYSALPQGMSQNLITPPEPPLTLDPFELEPQAARSADKPAADAAPSRKRRRDIVDIIDSIANLSSDYKRLVDAELLALWPIPAAGRRPSPRVVIALTAA